MAFILLQFARREDQLPITNKATCLLLQGFKAGCENNNRCITPVITVPVLPSYYQMPHYVNTFPHSFWVTAVTLAILHNINQLFSITSNSK